jgi:predicted nucleic acid-binding protein
VQARWLLDTCVVSELSRPVPDARVVDWLGRHRDDYLLSAVTLGEVAYGVERLPHGAQRNALQRWAADLHRRFASRTLVTDEAVWITFGRLKASLRSMGRPQEDLDIILAATAIVNGLTLATRNLRDFADTGVALVNPWEGGPSRPSN